MRSSQTRQSGQTAILFTLGLTAMFGMVGLVSDLGYVYYRKQVAQAAAQAAASAAVKSAYARSSGNFQCNTNNVECYSSYPPTYSCPSSISGNGANNLETGCLYAAANGYSGSKVTFQSGTGRVEGIYTTYWVIARVSEQLPLLFSAVAGAKHSTIVARSVAGYIVKAQGGCIYVIAPNGVSFTTSGNGYLQTGCGVWDNSTDSNAVNLNGANTYICVGTWNSASNSCTPSTTYTTQIVGGYTCGGSNTNCIQPSPTTGATSAGDPMAGLPTPSYNPGNCVTPPSWNGNQTYHQTNPTGTVCFTGDLSVQKGTLQLDPGTYIFTGCSGNGGLSASGNGNITGTGVFIYFTGGCSASFTGNGNITLTASTSGTYDGVLMFQDKNDTSDMYLTGGATQVLNGIVYEPAQNSTLHYTGGSSSTNCPTCTQSLSIVTYNLKIAGNSYIQSAGNSPYLTSYSGVAMIE